MAEVMLRRRREQAARERAALAGKSIGPGMMAFVVPATDKTGVGEG